MTRWEQIERIRKKYYGKYSRRAKKALKAHVKPIFDYLERFEIEGIMPQIDILIDKEPIKELFISIYKEVGLRFRKEASRQLKKNLQDEIWIEDMLEYIETISGGRITLIAGTTKEIVERTIKRILSEQVDTGGLSITETKRNLIKSLRTEFARVEDWRALRIAHTEVMTASNVGIVKVEDEITIPVRKIWITAPYGLARTKERHTLMGLEDQKPMKGQPFIVDGVEMQHPGDPAGGADNVVNCRCSLAYEPIELN